MLHHMLEFCMYLLIVGAEANDSLYFVQNEFGEFTVIITLVYSTYDPNGWIAHGLESVIGRVDVGSFRGILLKDLEEFSTVEPDDELFLNPSVPRTFEFRKASASFNEAKTPSSRKGNILI